MSNRYLNKFENLLHLIRHSYSFRKGVYTLVRIDSPARSRATAGGSWREHLTGAREHACVNLLAIQRRASHTISISAQFCHICADFSQSQRIPNTYSPGAKSAGTRRSSTMSVLKGSRPEHCSEKDVKLAQNMQAGRCIPVRIQL